MITKEQIEQAANESYPGSGLNEMILREAFRQGANWAIKQLSGLIELRETEAEQSENWAKSREAQLEKASELWLNEKQNYEASIEQMRKSAIYFAVRLNDAMAEIARLKSQISDNQTSG